MAEYKKESLPHCRFNHCGNQTFFYKTLRHIVGSCPYGNRRVFTEASATLQVSFPAGIGELTYTLLHIDYQISSVGNLLIPILQKKLDKYLAIYVYCNIRISAEVQDYVLYRKLPYQPRTQKHMELIFSR